MPGQENTFPVAVNSTPRYFNASVGLNALSSSGLKENWTPLRLKGQFSLVVVVCVGGGVNALEGFNLRPQPVKNFFADIPSCSCNPAGIVPCQNQVVGISQVPAQPEALKANVFGQGLNKT